MTRIALLLCLLYTAGFAGAQTIELKELSGLLDLSINKLESQLQKKGFRRGFLYDAENLITPSYMRTGKDALNPVVQNIQKTEGEESSVLYQTSSEQEFNALTAQLKAEGFSSSKRMVSGKEYILYQRESLSIESFRQQIDTMRFYCFRANRKKLPGPKEINQAEDLLRIDGHEYLAAVFGRQNIREDVFHYTEEESNKCTVLFPNSSREVIYIWNDEESKRELSFVLVGGNLLSKKSESANLQAHNAWGSAQGIYCGMSLKELEKLNGEPISFYNWHTESAGYLTPKNKGAIDFEKIGLVFSCLNCDFVEASQEDIITSNEAQAKSQKIFVSTMIILPGKGKQEGSVR